MSKKMIIYIIITVIIILFGGYFIYNYYQNQPKIVEIKDFSCPGMIGFTFKYPVFELKNSRNNFGNIAWPIGTGENECTILFNTLPKGTLPVGEPQIKINRYPSAVLDYDIKFINKYKIHYLPNYMINEIGYDFQVGDNIVRIKLENIKENSGFSSDLFFKTVIESFRLISIPPDKAIQEYEKTLK